MLSLRNQKYVLTFNIFFLVSVCLSGCHLQSNGNTEPIVDWDTWKVQDLDHDTLSNGQELFLGLDFRNSDSDNDFIPDNIEIRVGSNPLDGDENMNGILDGLEGDAFFAYQWYIYNDKNQSICTTTDVKTIAGIDLDILPLYHRTFGDTFSPVVVQVVDGGVDAIHEDLDISLEHSSNSITGMNDPSPTEGISSNPVQIFYRGHGTMVAGIIGAKGFNDIGIRGVAPKVKIAGSNWLESQEIEKLEPVWYNGNKANEIAISNNSWGSKYLDEKSYEGIMKAASEELRDGKGRIFVFASGNEREEYSNANLSYLINNPYAITVAALNHENKYASYSTPGSNVLVSAYGGEHYYTAPTIMTTFSTGLSMSESSLIGKKGPITIEEDSSYNYTYAMNGTSAAAPMVSGALALVLDKCPSLTWRDVRWLIAKHAKRIDVSQNEWVQNSAGLWHNNNYGFGRIDANAMVEECLSSSYKHLGKEKIIEKSISIDNRIIPDTNISIVENMIIKQNIKIEWIGLTVKINHPYAGDIDIELVSPTGTVAHIIEPNFLKYNAYINGFRFSTVALMGEMSAGQWQVRIRDALDDDEGTLQEIDLEIRGSL